MLTDFDKVQKYMTLVNSSKSIPSAKRKARQIAVTDTKPARTKKKKLEINADKSYSKQEWWNELTADERAKVKELREAKKKKGRKVSAVAPREDEGEEDEKATPDKNAGNQFGRASHQKVTFDKKTAK